MRLTCCLEIQSPVCAICCQFFFPKILTMIRWADIYDILDKWNRAETDRQKSDIEDRRQ
jgi:hypothetical protein